RCGPDATVIAVDPWAAAMARLRRKVEYLGLGNVRLIEADAAQLDLPASSVDVVVSNLGINNFANADAVLGMCAHVLRPGGKLFLTTNLVGHMSELYDVYRATLIELGLRDHLSALDTHIAHRATIESVTAMLARAGLKVTEVVTDTFTMRFAD